MKYLVMETHPAYAVVLDQEGRFLKAANLRYQVGDTVEEIVELRPPRKRSAAMGSALAGLAGLAACLCLVFFGYYQPNFTPYGTLRIQINPDVEMTVSRTDRVLALKGLNEDGEALIAGDSLRGKDREEATQELMERAIEMGYLSDGDTVSITVTSSDPDWKSREELAVRAQLEERYGETIVIRISPAEEPEGPPADQVVIPVAPAGTPSPGSGDTSGSGGSTHYGDTGYGQDGDTDYGPDTDESTDDDDDDGDDGPYVDGDTDYGNPGGDDDNDDDGNDREDDEDEDDDDDGNEDEDDSGDDPEG